MKMDNPPAAPKLSDNEAEKIAHIEAIHCAIMRNTGKVVVRLDGNTVRVIEHNGSDIRPMSHVTEYPKWALRQPVAEAVQNWSRILMECSQDPRKKLSDYL